MKNKLSRQDYGVLCRRKFVKHFEKKWGSYEVLRKTLFEFSNGRKVLTPFASLSYNRWWFGISKQYWKNWDNQTYMALLMREGNKCDFVLLNPTESLELLNGIKPVTSFQKMINVYLPSGSGRIYIQEWQDFPFEQNIVHLGNIEDSDVVEKFEPSIEKNINDPNKKKWICTSLQLIVNNMLN